MNQVSPVPAYKIAVIGLGYVGLPLAMAFSRQFTVVGFDVDKTRIGELLDGFDRTKETSAATLASVSTLTFTDKREDLVSCNVFIVTVPTPLDANKEPDLSFLISASETIGRYLKKGDIVIYESTVYPGCTEEDCVPVLERTSGLVYNQDFYCGYSPERINPGDKIHTLETIKKITSGSTPEIADIIDELYAAIITAGTYKAPSIKVAEAAKAIENAQRDVNISFMNELALIFDRMGIDTGEVLEAAATKWNFLPFKPGLVGGHCIGVDPHYLAYKATKLGYEPQVILSGRKVNEQMGVFVAEKVIALLAAAYQGDIRNRRVLILGFAFKENCGDTRNTKVIDIVRTLEKAELTVFVYDPVVDTSAIAGEYPVTFTNTAGIDAEALVLAVAHDVFRSIDFVAMKEKRMVIFDAKNFLKKGLADGRL